MSRVRAAPPAARAAADRDLLEAALSPERAGRADAYGGDAAAGDELLPMIRMRGRWLAQLGFTRDALVVVSEEQGRIVLTLAGEE